MNILHRHPPLFNHDTNQRLRDLEAILFAILKNNGPQVLSFTELRHLEPGRHVEMTANKTVNGAAFCGMMFEAVEAETKKEAT